jgi:hypothetical protein
MGRTLTDQEALDRLTRASDALGTEPADSVAAATALAVARGAMTTLILGLEGAVECGVDTVEGVVTPET